jgi:hypothetical protein
VRGLKPDAAEGEVCGGVEGMRWAGALIWPAKRPRTLGKSITREPPGLAFAKRAMVSRVGSKPSDSNAEDSSVSLKRPSLSSSNAAKMPRSCWLRASSALLVVCFALVVALPVRGAVAISFSARCSAVLGLYTGAFANTDIIECALVRSAL